MRFGEAKEFLILADQGFSNEFFEQAKIDPLIDQGNMNRGETFRTTGGDVNKVFHGSYK